MAEENKLTQTNSSLIGATAEPTTLDSKTNIDIDINNGLIDNIIATGTSGQLDIGALERFTSISNSRENMYNLIDTMAKDSAVSAILKTYAEECCETSDNGHIIWCESADPKISKFVNYLLNLMNADKHIYGWTYCLLKYGDVYLKLYRESDYNDPFFKKDKIDTAYASHTKLNESIVDEDFNQFKDSEQESLDESVKLSLHSSNDKYSYYVEMISDPCTIYELNKYGRTCGFIETPNEETKMDYLSNYNAGVGQNYNNYRMKSNDVIVWQADDFVHACLDDNFDRYPETVDLFMNDEDLKNNVHNQSYKVKRGKSLLYDNYKVWREKALLENSILLNRLTKSSIVRNVQVEVGDMPKSQVQNTLRRIKELFEQKSAINTDNSMSEYASPGPVENNIFTASHNGKGVITVNSVGGDIEVKNLGDLDEWVNKFYAAYGIPKAYFGYTDDGAGFNGGQSLAIISSVFAKSVKRVQNAMIQAITDAINLFLINRGCKSYVNNFALKMKSPTTQEDKDYRESLTNRVSAISNIQSLFADVEDKARKLRILRDLVSTLNLGDNLLFEIDQEAKEADEAKKKAAAEEAMKETEETEQETNSDFEQNDLDSADDELPELPPMESFTSNGGGTTLVEGPDFMTESDDLPTPEEADSTKDFTQNN